MASNAKKKTTMAKLNRERKLRERRQEKQAKKEARKLAAEGELGSSSDPEIAAEGELGSSSDPEIAAEPAQPLIGAEDPATAVETPAES